MFPRGAGATTRRVFSSPLRQAKHEAPGRGVWRGAGVPAWDRGCAPRELLDQEGAMRPQPREWVRRFPSGRGDALPSPGVQAWAPQER